MIRPIHYLILGTTICSMVILAGCYGLAGTVFERKPGGGIGQKIPGVEITFTSEDGSITKTVTTDNTGSFNISLSTSRYVVTAIHPDYEDYTSAPDYFVVTGDGNQIGNIFMKRKGQ